MNKFKHIIVVILFSIISLSAQADFDLDNVGLVTSDSLVLRELTELESILGDIKRSSPSKDLVFYIHGRGRDIDKEFQTILNLESSNNVRVIMFKWPSWSSLITRPVNNAQEAARELSDVFYKLKNLKQQNSELLKNKKMSIFIHSMGNIIFETFVREFYAETLNPSKSKKLFDNIALMGADVGMYTHRSWLSRVDFGFRKYVAMNNSDIVLQLSNLLDWKNGEPMLYRLGLGFDRRHIKKKMDIPNYLDPSSIYIDLSRSLRLDHKYFDLSKPTMAELFGPMIVGEKVDFKKISLKHRVEYGINYLID